MKAEPQKEHRWLHQLVGEWDYESEAIMGPGEPPIKHGGTQSTRSIGGVWIQAEGTGAMPDGGPSTMLMTLGFDPARGKFVGTFVGSMMTHLWVYEGGLDADERVLTLEAEGPSFADMSETAKYRDAIEVVSGDHHVLTSEFLADDGRWHRFMTAHYRRKA